MTGYGTTSVVTDNLREEAGKWRDLANRLDEVQRDPVGDNGLALEPTAGNHTGAVEKAIDQIRRNIEKIASEAEKLIDRCNSKWLTLSPAVKYFIHQKIKEFRATLDRILRFAEEVLAHYTPVLSLVNISFHWLNAVEATAEKAGFLSEWLYGIVLANVEFVAELSTVIGEIAGEVTAAALEAATVIDIPWAIDRLAAACGLIVEKHINTLLSIAQRIVAAGENARKVISDRVDYSRFPGGAWPQAVKG